MPNLLHLRLVTVDKVLMDEDIYSIITSNTGGQFEILPGHSPFITLTRAATTTVTLPGGEKKVLFTSDGIMRVLHDEIIFITDSGEFKEDIVRERAEAALKRSDEMRGNGSLYEREKADEAYHRAKERLKTLDSN